jgi:superfamily II DNA/RNA helicase
MRVDWVAVPKELRARRVNRVLILDEADRLLALGFSRTLQRILAHIPARAEQPSSDAAIASSLQQAAAAATTGDVGRSAEQQPRHQTLLFSATWSAHTSRMGLCAYHATHNLNGSRGEIMGLIIIRSD